MPLYMKMSQNINKTTRHLIFRIYKEKKSIGILKMEIRIIKVIKELN